MDILGEEKEVTMTMAFKGEMMYFGMQDAGMLSADIIFRDGVMYTVSHEEKAVMKMEMDKDEAAEDVFGSIGVIPEDYRDLDDYTAGSEEINGKTYDYEDFESEFEDVASIRYYFEGDDLKYIKEFREDNPAMMEILEVSGEAPSEIFELPAGYAVIDLTEMIKNMNLGGDDNE